jgi:hypothetical protein
MQRKEYSTKQLKIKAYVDTIAVITDLQVVQHRGFAQVRHLGAIVNTIMLLVVHFVTLNFLLA